MKKNTPHFQSQRGGGKIGCLISFIVVAIIAAIGLKIFPVHRSNNQFIEAVEDIANRAGKLDEGTIQAQIIEKAKEFKIPEAQNSGAINVSRTVSKEAGMCTVRINYAREIDLYGIVTIKLATDKNIAKPFIIM